jgi:hypothetical protein
MRHAREGTGLGPDGDKLLVFRSPPSMREGCADDLSFGLWSESNDLPLHDDDVTSFEIGRPYAGVPVGFLVTRVFPHQELWFRFALVLLRFHRSSRINQKRYPRA